MKYWMLGIALVLDLTGSALAGDATVTRRPAAPPAPVVAEREAPRPPAATNFARPPLPEGVTELSFQEFFQQPVGPRGLEISEKLRSLDGKPVRLLGYMIQQSDPMPHSFLFAPLPVQMHEHEYGFADELPASTVHVFVETNTAPRVPYTPGPMLLTGKLSVGNRQEPSGRVSLVRLQLDPPTAEQREALARAQAREAAHPAHRHDHGEEHAH